MGQTAQIRVGGITALCPRCEAPHFTVAGPAELLACGSCGTQVHQTALIAQIAANARLMADYMAEHTRHNLN